MKRKSVKYL